MQVIRQRADDQTKDQHRDRSRPGHQRYDTIPAGNRDDSQPHQNAGSADGKQQPQRRTSQPLVAGLIGPLRRAPSLGQCQSPAISRSPRSSTPAVPTTSSSSEIVP
jgi:hypothetical protein